MQNALLADNIQGGKSVYFRLQDTIVSNYRRFSVTLQDANNPGRKFCTPILLQDEKDKIWKIVPPQNSQWSNIMNIHINNSLDHDCRGNVYKSITEGYNHLNNFYVSDSILGNYWSYYVPVPSFSPDEKNFDRTKDIAVDYCSSVRQNFIHRLSFLDIPTNIDTTTLYNYQWFKYINGGWERLDTLWIKRKNPISEVSSSLFPQRLDTTFFTLLASKYDKDIFTYVDFAIDNLNFTSSYLYNNKDIDEDGMYSVVKSLDNIYKSTKRNVFDHTYGNARGSMYVCHCNERDEVVLWKQTFDNIQSDADYMFSFWVMRWDSTSNDSIELEITINNVPLKRGIFVSGLYNQWQEVRVACPSVPEGIASFAIVNRTQKVHGAELAIDDIMLRKKEDVRYLFKVFYDDITSKHVNDTLVCCDTLIPYKWHGRELVKRGKYYDTLRNDLDCDSIWYSLTFSIKQCCPPVQRTNITSALCDTIIPYTWHNLSIEKNGIYYFFAQDYKGCDSIYDTLNVEITRCQNCYYDMLYRKYDDILFVENPGNLFVSYQWYHNNVALPGENKQYYHSRDTLSGFYHVAVTDINNNINNICSSYYADIPYSISTYLHETETKDGNLSVYNHLGQLIYRGENLKNKTLMSFLSPGIYIVLEFRAGKKYIHKIIKNE